MQSDYTCILWPETKLVLVHHILYRIYCIFTPKVLWLRSFLIFIVGWTEELCSQHLPQVGVLVMYWELCIELRECHYITSPIGYWGKGSTISWYLVLAFLLLVIVCFDNNGFSGVVTLNSPGGVLPRWFSPFINKSPMSNLFSVAFNLVGDLFLLPHSLHVIESN